MSADVYRRGGPTHIHWLKDLDALNKVITESDSLVTDPDDGWIGVDPSKLPVGVADLYAAHIQAGAWNGWLVGAAS